MSRNAPILLPEDDENDVFLFRRAFGQSGLSKPLFAVKDGQEAVDYMSGKGAYADSSLARIRKLHGRWLDGAPKVE